MHSLERTRASISGEPVDRIPTFPILLAPACRLLGVKQGAYNLDAGIMANTLIKARDLLARPEVSAPKVLVQPAPPPHWK